MDFSKPVQVGWYKLNKNAIIPTKTKDNAGFDIYTIDTDVTIMPHERYLFSTGLAVAVSEGWWLKVEERGSTGTKGLARRCGIVDNNFRGQIFICIQNDNNYPIRFTNKEEPGFHQDAFFEGSYFVYPISKAIAQMVLIPQPEVNSYELTPEEWELVKNTDRGAGMLGSSGK